MLQLYTWYALYNFHSSLAIHASFGLEMDKMTSKHTSQYLWIFSTVYGG